MLVFYYKVNVPLGFDAQSQAVPGVEGRIVHKILFVHEQGMFAHHPETGEERTVVEALDVSDLETG